MLAGDESDGYLMPMRCRFVYLLPPLLALSWGCKQEEEVRVYQAPKERATSPATAAAGAGPASTPTTPAANAPAPRPPWTVPDGWTEKASTGGMRIASYAINSADGRSVDVSVVPLGGQSGSMLDNVNRWRDQVGLGTLTEAELAGSRQAVKIGEYDGELYEMVSDKPMLDNKYKVRTLAAVLPLPGTTVFFKATGEDALVRENADKFKNWLKSVQTGSPAGAPSSGAAPSAGAPGTPPDMRGPVAPPPSTSLPQWEVPATWKSVPASTMRLASFALSGPNNQTGDLSVVALGPAAGGTLANVNRWRNQFGLGPIDDATLTQTTTTTDLTGGGKAVIVELVGEGTSAGKRMLAAIVPRPDRTWFYKLTGDDALISGEKANFLKFVQSVKYP